MIRTGFRYLLATLFISTLGYDAYAQSMHFSQYYNSPMLQNPANTALMSDNDYRIGANYRKQWATIPVPYSTMSIFGDFQALRNETESNNWMGLGIAMFSDKAGNGDLSLLQAQGSVAYHLQLNETSMLSGGISAGYVQRSVNYDKLTFDVQWDGFSFNQANNNGEKNNVVQTGFLDVGAGVNYAFFPTENLYFKIGGGVAHVNQPVQTFYNDGSKVSMRPIGNADALINLNSSLTLNPSVYYTSQSGASEFIYGTQLFMYLRGDKENITNFIFGFYHRISEAIIGVAGLQYGGLKVTASYDITMSKLGPDNNNQGAAEFSVIFMGKYLHVGSGPRNMNCPRF